MGNVKMIILIILIVFPAFVFAQNKSKNKSISDITSMSSQEFEGFDKCETSEKLYSTTGKLISSGKPINKEKDSWTYAIKSEVMGLPVKAIKVGVCDASGERACGFGSFIAVVISKPLKDARSHLKKNTGIDYTKGKRSEDTEITLRPVLIRGKKSDESILYCDPGIL